MEFVVAAAIVRAALAEQAVLAILNPLIEGIVVAQVSFLVLDRWRDQQVVGRLEGQRAAEHRRFAAIGIPIVDDPARIVRIDRRISTRSIQPPSRRCQPLTRKPILSCTIGPPPARSEEHTSELQSLMRTSYA